MTTLPRRHTAGVGGAKPVSFFNRRLRHIRKRIPVVRQRWRERRSAGFNGLGVWHGNERKEKLSTLHGIWLWDHTGASPCGRPTLYANLDIENLSLPKALHSFKHNTRGHREGQQVRIIRGDGEATYDPAVLIEAWEEYHRKRPDEVL